MDCGRRLRWFRCLGLCLIWIYLFRRPGALSWIRLGLVGSVGRRSKRFASRPRLWGRMLLRC